MGRESTPFTEETSRFLCSQDLPVDNKSKSWGTERGDLLSDTGRKNLGCDGRETPAQLGRKCFHFAEEL